MIKFLQITLLIVVSSVSIALCVVGYSKHLFDKETEYFNIEREMEKRCHGSWAITYKTPTSTNGTWECTDYLLKYDKIPSNGTNTFRLKELK